MTQPLPTMVFTDQGWQPRDSQGLVPTFAGLNVFTLEEFGAVGDGVTNDQPALTTALATIAALPMGGTILLGSGKTYLVQGGTLPANSSIVGWGDSSILKTVSNQTVITIGGEHCYLGNFRILGNGVGANQRGVQDGVIGVPNSGFSIFQAFNVTVQGMGNDGWLFVNTNSNLHGPLLTQCSAIANAVVANGAGFNVDVAEYTQFENCLARDQVGIGGATGVRIASGNIKWTGGGCNANQIGFYIVSSTNNAHGVVSGAEINHNALPVQTTTGISAGFLFVGCNIFFGDIYLIGSVPLPTQSICFQDCRINVGDLIFQGSTGIRFDNCTFPKVGAANNIFPSFTGVASTEFWTYARGNRGEPFVPGLIPPNYTLATPTLYSASVATAAVGQLTKISGAGTIAPLTVLDPPSAVLGPCQDAVLIGADVRVSDPAQSVIMLCDGAAPIAIGDPVTTSGVSPGRVAFTAVAGTVILGRALRAGALLDDPIEVFFEPTVL